MGVQRMQLASSSGVAFAAEHFEARETFRPGYDRVAEVLCAVLDFQSAIDVGCGQGFLVDALLAHGIDVQGIEKEPAALAFASEQATPRIAVGDALWAAPHRIFDLACCVEVAEHVAPEHSRALVARVASLADTVFFTAASPYQPGHGHINCRPATDWIYFFSNEGFRLDIERTIDIRARLGTTGPAPWISMNTMLFTKE